MKRTLVLMATLMVADKAQSFAHVAAKVSLVEATYVPTAVAFILSEGTASCPAGKLLFWKRDSENNKAVYAMLMTAMASGKRIQVVFNDGDAGCVPQYMHMLD